MENIVNEIIAIIQGTPLFISLFLCIAVIIIESFIPVLPLGLFIALNTLVFGNVFGYIISYIGTIIGCILSFLLCRKVSNFKVEENDIKKAHKLARKFRKLDLSTLIVITSLPFSPAFLINMACGYAKMSRKKFLTNILISKVIVVYFWGYVGLTFMELFENPMASVRLIIVIGGTFVFSKVVLKKFNIE